MSKPAPFEDLGGEEPRRAAASSRTIPMVPMLLAAAGVAVAVAVFWAAEWPSAAPSAVLADDHPVTVQYTIRTSPSTTEGSSLLNVTRIEFHPGYVVVRTREGGGKVLFGENTISLNWIR